MKPFLDEDFLLQTETAKTLFHGYAEEMPIFDYHCHLPVAEIAANKRFENLTQIWLHGDHGKWRAMRANGIDERFITGDADDFDKFRAWAETVPRTLRNPLYHWTHLEMKRYFGITGKLLGPDTAREIYDTCNEMLQTDAYRPRNLLERMNVKVVCTTGDPVDNLEHHGSLLQLKDFSTVVLPAFRPDKALAVETPGVFNAWVGRLADAADLQISDYEDFIRAIRKRHDFFQAAGCRLSDHGIEEPYARPFALREIRRLFERVRSGDGLTQSQIHRFKSAVLLELTRMNAEKNWTQQFHLGALRNVNSRAGRTPGPDAGYDSIGDFRIGQPLAALLDRLEREGSLTRTILCVSNPRDNELIATMTANFQDGRTPGKIQFGSGWRFNDQKDGMERQINALSSMGLLSRFVGMPAGSRSFLSYPRHEVFRRVLCNLLGTDVENGELPADLELIGGMVRDICWNNAVVYFGIDPP